MPNQTLTADPASSVTQEARSLHAARVAYFSMEIALQPNIPTYSGGLGVLAGDTLRAAADLELPILAVTLVHRKGYFRQQLDTQGRQTEEPQDWRPEDSAELMAAGAWVMIEGRRVHIRAWRYTIRGVTGATVPVYLLDSDVEANAPWDRHLTDSLYGGDAHYRLCQETLLGIGGLKMLRRLGHSGICTFHMNEGHSALLTIGLLEEQAGEDFVIDASPVEIEQVRNCCVFTTHTPVPAGHDQFDRGLVRQVLGERRTLALEHSQCCPSERLNMTYLALRFSRYINGVALRHGEISHDMFPEYPIRAITNGVHAVTWAAPAFQSLYDRHFPEWRSDNTYLRYAIGLDLAEVQTAHRASKQATLDAIYDAQRVKLRDDVFTIGFARRATEYKRAELLFADPNRLRAVVEQHGALQIVFAGKAHPKDEGGKAIIERIYQASRTLQSDAVKIVYIQDYDLRWGSLLTSGVDLWLSTPQRPHEASGTSGMKAALNGVPSLSVLDGWWVEGCLEGTTGWAIGTLDSGPEQEVVSLYDQLEKIMSMFYQRPAEFAVVMRSAISVNASFFNTQRMVVQYARNAYFSRTVSPSSLAMR